MPFKDPEKRKAAQRAAMQRKRDRDRNPGPGRPRKHRVVQGPPAAPRAGGAGGGARQAAPAGSMASPSSAPPPEYTLEEIKATEPWGPDDAQRYLTLEAQRSPLPQVRLSAASKLLDSRRKDGGGEGAHDAEWEELRRDPVAMDMMKTMVERRKAAKAAAG